ncbi:hypothetical protein SAMN02787118_13660 [Streptomyces mirabilis]|uniref:Uncharacterized protein n=1 Tax=Streptomyces mirabilis TaxID=68239 RepID=A0A1I2WEN4_9ACTN|nr:hypothetical protein SAMN02787118_13660 [Streptomyces mirabilis]
MQEAGVETQSGLWLVCQDWAIWRCILISVVLAASYPSLIPAMGIGTGNAGCLSGGLRAYARLSS